MCDLDIDGRPEFHSKTTPRARVVHRCRVCRRVIHSGERYVSETFKWEGDVGVDPCCLPCARDRDEFGAAHRRYPFPSSFVDFLVDCISDGDEESDRVWRPMFNRIKRRRRVAERLESPGVAK